MKSTMKFLNLPALVFTAAMGLVQTAHAVLPIAHWQQASGARVTAWRRARPHPGEPAARGVGPPPGRAAGLTRAAAPDERDLPRGRFQSPAG